MRWKVKVTLFCDVKSKTPTNRGRFEGDTGAAYFFIEQVLMPKIEYAGQMPMSPVNNGTTPM
jgi:hypothetical protein